MPLPAVLDVFSKLESKSPFHGQPPLFLNIRSSKIFILFTCCTAVFTDVFLYGVIVPVIPFAIRDRAGIPQAHVQHWVSVLLAVYGAALLVGSPICGILADRSPSRRAPLLIGLFVLAGATLMLCLGTSIAVLVAARALQGASASVVWVVGLALLADTVGKEQSGQAIGYVTLSYSLGTLVAPLLGGVVYARSGYYAVFGMTFAVVGLDIVLRLLLIEKKIAAKWLPEEPPQASRIVDGATSGIALQDLKSPRNIPHGSDVEDAGPRSEPHSAKKVLPLLTLLKSRRILAAFWGNFAMAAVIVGFDTTLPLFCNRIFGWNSLGAGLIFLTLIVPSFSGPIIGYCVDRYGPRWIAATGFLLALPFLVLLRLVDHDSIRQIVLFCVLLVFVGVAVALALTSLMSEFSKVCDAMERKQPGLFGQSGAYAQSYSIFNSAWAAGSLIGPLWAAGVEARSGWKTMTWSLGLLSAVSVVPVVLYSGGTIWRRKE